MWHQWFNLIFLKLWEYFLCAKKTKIITLFNNFFSSVSVFDALSQEYHDACVWCSWLHRLHILVGISKAGQKIASHPLCQNLQTCWWRLFYVHCASSSACKQATAHLSSMSECQLRHQQKHHTHVSWYSHEHVSKTDMEEKKLWSKVIIFVFFAHKKYSHSLITLRLNH